MSTTKSLYSSPFCFLIKKMVSKVETEYSNYDFEVSLEGISPKLNSIGSFLPTHFLLSGRRIGAY